MASGGAEASAEAETAIIKAGQPETVAESARRTAAAAEAAEAAEIARLERVAEDNEADIAITENAYAEACAAPGEGAPPEQQCEPALEQLISAALKPTEDEPEERQPDPRHVLNLPRSPQMTEPPQPGGWLARAQPPSPTQLTARRHP